MSTIRSPLIPIFVIRVGSDVSGIDLAADGQRVAVACRRGAYLYDALGRRKFAFHAVEFPFAAVALTSAGANLWGLAQEGILYSFDLTRPLSVVPYDDLRHFAAPGDLRAISVTPSGDRIALGHLGQRITVLDRTGKVLRSWELQLRSWHVALTADGQRVVVASLGSPVNAIYIYDINTGELCAGPFRTRTGQRVTALRLLPGSEGVAVALSGGEYDNSLELLSADLKERKWVTDLPCTVAAMSVDDVGGFLALGGNDGFLYLFDHRAQTLIARHDPFGAPITSVTLTSDGQHLAIAVQDHVHLLRNDLVTLSVTSTPE